MAPVVRFEKRRVETIDEKRDNAALA